MSFDPIDTMAYYVAVLFEAWYDSMIDENYIALFGGDKIAAKPMQVVIADKDDLAQ